MVAKTFQGLEEILAEELRGLGAENVEPGKRMVSFDGDLATLYKANVCCRTALRILKPFYSFTAENPDELYEKAKDYDWMTLLSLDKTFSVDTTSHSEEFTHSKYATYRVKDAIVDKFRDRFGEDKRPGVRVTDADVVINVHISGKQVTLSLDSSGESLSRRGYMVERTEAPINEVLAAGIIMMSGWRGDEPFIDPMCGSGTFLIEAALIAARINPGLFRRSFAFEKWKDFDAELFDKIYNDDTDERVPPCPIVGADISPKAIAIANANIKSAGMAKYITTSVKALDQWEEAPQPAGVLVTNPPYGERLRSQNMDELYELIGSKLKHVFRGYHAWIIGYRDEFFHKIGLAPSQKIDLNNGGLDCQLREYIIFEGDRKSFKAAGGQLVSGMKTTCAENIKRADKKIETGKERYGFGVKPDFGGRSFGYGTNPEKKEPRRFGSRSDAKYETPNALKSKYEKTSPKRFRDEGDRKRDKYGRPSEQPRELAPRPKRLRGADSKARSELYSEALGIEGSAENPLLRRRNPKALLSLSDKQPSIKPSEGPIMRSRGWKKQVKFRNPEGAQEPKEHKKTEEN